MSTLCDDLLPLFLEEFDERLTCIEGILLSDDSTSEVSMKTVKRELHTIKGNSAAVGFPSCSSLCHHLEDYMDHATDPAELVDQLLDGIQILRGAVCSMAEGRDIDDSAQLALSKIGAKQEAADSPPAAETHRLASSTTSTSESVEPEPLKANFLILLAASDELAGSAANLVADYGVRSLPLSAVIDADAQMLGDGMGASHAFVVHLNAAPQTVVAAVRMIERYRLGETTRGLFGESRLPIVAIVDGGDENACRELRAAGAQYAFAVATDPRISNLLHRLFLASLKQRNARKSVRFRDLKTTYATFRDGSRYKVKVRDESRTGIAIQLLDPSPCGMLVPVSVNVLGASMPAYVVRVTGRDERGYVTVGLKWGHHDESAV